MEIVFFGFSSDILWLPQLSVVYSSLMDKKFADVAKVTAADCSCR